MNIHGVSEYEAGYLLAAADDCLDSEAGQTVVITGTTGSTDSTDGFHTRTGGTATTVKVTDINGDSVDPRAIQDFIRPNDRRLADFEEFLSGDCIFWLQRDVVLTGVENIVVTDAAGLTWTALLQPGVALKNYLESVIQGTAPFLGLHCRRML